jgi:hypothetical protein
MKLKHFFLTATLLFSSLLMKAQNVDEIIDKHIKAMGGREKMKSLSSSKTTTKMKMQMFEFPVVTTVTKSGSMKTETTIQGMKMEQAYDSKTKSGWYVNPMQGDKTAQKMNEEQLKEMNDDDKIESPLLDYKLKGHTAEYLGKDDFEGEEVYKIMLTKKNGNIVYYYIDTQNYCIWKETTKIKLKEKEFESESYYSNYTMVDGIITAFTTENYANGKVQMQMNVEKIEYNVPVDDKLFKMPEPKKPDAKKTEEVK